MSLSKKSIFETHPEIAKQWHPTKNGTLTPNDVTKGSIKIVWWKCEKGDDHEWDTSTNKRTSSNTNCPVCSNQMIVKSNCLATTNPILAKQWHPSKNSSLTPFLVSEGSNKKAWWKCEKGDDHEWPAVIASRQNNGCPFCSGKRVTKSNSLANNYPDLLKFWDFKKNNPITPKTISYGSDRKVWWICSNNSNHIYDCSVSNKVHGRGCPYCSGQKIHESNSLAKNKPLVAKQWHPTKNGTLTPNDVTIGSSQIVWWKCEKGDDHEWESAISNRSNGTGCPICSGKKVVKSNCLTTTHPEIAKQWHPTKNGTLTPNDVTKGSIKIVWWKCEKGDDHEWDTSTNKRTSSNTNCPVCSNQMIVKSNCLATTNPILAKQWHPSKNSSLTPFLVSEGSNKKAWWKCEKGDDHEWPAVIASRQNNGCPFCNLTPQSRQELIITFELKILFKNIDPKGFKTRLNRKLRAVDIFISKLNLCIEFDGSYWHKDKRDLDKIKSEMLLEEGFKLIRVRQEPLKKIYDSDIISKQPYNGKNVTNDILSIILNIFDLDQKLISKIKDYQSKEGLQNEKELEKYIDQILDEKANKS